MTKDYNHNTIPAPKGCNLFRIMHAREQERIYAESMRKLLHEINRDIGDIIRDINNFAYDCEWKIGGFSNNCFYEQSEKYKLIEFRRRIYELRRTLYDILSHLIKDELKSALSNDTLLDILDESIDYFYKYFDRVHELKEEGYDGLHCINVVRPPYILVKGRVVRRPFSIIRG